MLPTETSGFVPVTLEISLGGGKFEGVYTPARRDTHQSLRTLSELAETRRLHFGRTNKAFTKSEWAWVVDNNCFVCRRALGVAPNGELLFRSTSVSQTLIVWHTVSAVKSGTRIRYVDTLSHEPVIMIFSSPDPGTLSTKANVLRGA
jgi:hypothetical protein